MHVFHSSAGLRRPAEYKIQVNKLTTAQSIVLICLCEGRDYEEHKSEYLMVISQIVVNQDDFPWHMIVSQSYLSHKITISSQGYLLLIETFNSIKVLVSCKHCLRKISSCVIYSSKTLFEVTGTHNFLWLSVLAFLKCYSPFFLLIATNRFSQVM